jgi:hypothetical protein
LKIYVLMWTWKLCLLFLKCLIPLQSWRKLAWPQMIKIIYQQVARWRISRILKLIRAFTFLMKRWINPEWILYLTYDIRFLL